MASSYDRRGGNRDGSYACMRRTGGRCVIAEHTGPGEIDSIWSTRPRAGDVRRTGTLRVELDGRRVVDRSLADVAAGRLGAPFVFPAVATARQGSGAVWIKVPMPFRESMRVTTTADPGYSLVNYRTFDSADGVTAFDPDDPARDVLDQLRVQSDPSVATAIVGGVSGAGTITVGGPAVISRLYIDAPRGARIRMSFDGHRTVDVPLAELQGSGLPARMGSLMSTDRELRWPLPFLRTATVSVTGREVQIEAEVQRGDSPVTQALARGEAGYFRATHHYGRTVKGRPWTVLDAKRPGLLVGLSAKLAGPRSQRHLEGDDVIVADGRTLHGTGTEDFFGGGFYWYYGTRSLPLVGSPAHVVRRDGCAADCRSMYRWLIADAVPFTRSLRFTLEHGDRNRVAGTYSTTALWYAP